MEHFLTSGQVARKLRISISTLKRWTEDSAIRISNLRNQNGWRLFNESDLETLKVFKLELKRNGKRFSPSTLLPINSGQHKTGPELSILKHQ